MPSGPKILREVKLVLIALDGVQIDANEVLS